MTGAVPNPATPRMLRPVETITDRAKRYRANANPPAGPRLCAFCAAKNPRDIDHIDGDEANDSGANKQYLCRSCNTRKGITQRNAGAGTRTRQFNPERVPTYSQYLDAVLILRGDRSGNVPHAARVLQSIPESKRWEYIERIARARETPVYARARAAARNPDREQVPTFAQYAFGVAEHARGSHDEGGKIIHATPPRIRSEYAREIARRKRERRQDVPF